MGDAQSILYVGTTLFIVESIDPYQAMHGFLASVCHCHQLNILNTIYLEVHAWPTYYRITLNQPRL